MKRMFAVIVLLLPALSWSQATAPSQRIRGEIVAYADPLLTVKARGGETVTIRLAEGATVNAVVKVTLDTVAPGSYVGVASMPQDDNTQRALEVLVFPEAARGSGEGHYPWDLQPGSVMTNATVGAVSNIEAGRRLVLKYKDGEKTIVVPAGVPVVTFEPGATSMLKPGAHVMVTATPGAGGTLSAARVAVGKDGLVPPM